MLAANPKSSKAYYRSAMALLKLSRLDEALDCCQRCLEHDPDNKSVRDVRDKATKLKLEHEKKEKERQERIQKQEQERRRLNTACAVSSGTVLVNIS